MKLTPVGLSYCHSKEDATEYPTSYEAAVVRSINSFAKGEYGYESPSLEKQLRATQTVMANLIEHLVNRGLMNNEEFQSVLEQNQYRPEFKLAPNENG